MGVWKNFIEEWLTQKWLRRLENSMMEHLLKLILIFQILARVKIF
jgi:hypothetical protein